MNTKNSIIDSIRAKYEEDYLECSKQIDYTELTDEDGLQVVLYKDLPDTEVDGFPVASDYVSPDGKAYSMNEFEKLSAEEKGKCELRFYFLPNYHDIYIGTTGSGKTTGCVEPQLRAISSQKNKPNLFLTDPKGELFERNAQHLKDQGYQTFVLNFKDLIRSDRWNPLLEVYDMKMSTLTVGKGALMHTGRVKKSLEYACPKKMYSSDGYIEYDGKAFPDGEKFEEYVNFKRDFLGAEIDSLVNQLANMMISIKSTKDPTWEMGAQELLKGLIYCMLEDAIDPESGFTRDMMNLSTLQDYYTTLKLPILSGKIRLPGHPLLKGKSKKPILLMSEALDNAMRTMRSYCGIFDGSMKDWFSGHIFALTTNSTITVDNSEKQPFAIFLITRDYEKSDFQIAGLFIDWVYRQMIEKVENGEATRTLHFLLDEFGNIPEIKDFENKIATARSRNIWFHLAIQSYQQIDIVYGAEKSVVIRDNCNSHIFLGAQNRETKELFSEECGKHHVPTFESKILPKINSIQEVALVPVSDLDLIKPGQMYVKRLYMPVITSQFIRSYACAAQGTFKNFSKGLKTCTPYSQKSFKSPQFTYEKVVDDYFNLGSRPSSYDD